MNKLIKSSVILSAILLCITFQNCRKPKCPDDPCLNPVTVTALDPDQYGRGHFTYTDQQQTMMWLYATNWSDFASQVVPGRQYQIGYKEVPCKNDYTNHAGIAAGGCFIQRKCIVIKCLKPIKEKEGGCFESIMDPEDYNSASSQAISSTGIVGNSLKAKVGFSGCGDNYDKNFKLYLQLTPDKTTKPMGQYIFTAKAVNTYKDITCMAYFEKSICFDLSAVRNYYQRNNRTVPSQVIIRLLMGDKSQDFIYNP